MRALSVMMIAALLVILASGCTSNYVAPGRGAPMDALGVTPEMKAMGTEATMQAAFDRKPLASFPASIAVVRVQAGGYQSRTSGVAYGGGALSVVTTRDIETDTDFERLAKLPMVRGIAAMNRLVLPRTINTVKDLREAAANVQAEMVLIYTIDTQFFVDDFARPLTIVTLGLSPNRKARVYTTASAMLVDTRSGFIYGLAEATEQQDQLANAWTDDSAVDQTRLRTERAAFVKLVDELEKAWAGVVATHATPAARVP